MFWEGILVLIEKPIKRSRNWNRNSFAPMWNRFWCSAPVSSSWSFVACWIMFCFVKSQVLETAELVHGIKAKIKQFDSKPKDRRNVTKPHWWSIWVLAFSPAAKQKNMEKEKSALFSLTLLGCHGSLLFFSRSFCNSIYVGPQIQINLLSREHKLIYMIGRRKEWDWRCRLPLPSCQFQYKDG